MKRLTIASSALIIAGAAHMALAQPPGGGGGMGMSFDAINQADEDGNKDDHLTLEEVRAFFEEMMAGRGGGPAGGGGPGGGAGAGGEDFVATIFANWDTDPEGGDGKITEEEFENRPQGRRGGPPPQ